MSQFPLARLESNTLSVGIRTYLQKRHRIAILLFMHEHGTVQWRDLKYMPKRICNDSTFRVACVELTLLGLADQIPIDTTKNKWRLTDLGVVVADIIKRAFRDIEILIKESESLKAKTA